MPNGRCRMHGGATPKGRRHGAFKTGQFTAESIADREAAKKLRTKALQAFLKTLRTGRGLAMLLRDGKITPEEFEMVRKKLDEDVKKTNRMRNEALALQFSWLDRYWPPRRKRLPKKEPAK
jgi:hypothetical protein